MISVSVSGVVLSYLIACSIAFLAGCMAGLAIIGAIRRSQKDDRYRMRYRQGLSRQW